MKTLLIILGFASSAALAQMQAPDSTGSRSGSAVRGASGESGTSSMQSGGQSQDGTSSSDIAARLQPRTADGVSYVCGGVGKEEVRYMRKQAKNHDLMMEFATTRGEFLADVNVQIADARGNPVLQTRCDGPIMAVDLPRSGTYRVHADAAGYTLDQTVNVTHGRRGQVASLVLNWPQHVASAPSSAQTQTGGSGTRGSGASGEDRRHGQW